MNQHGDKPMTRPVTSGVTPRLRKLTHMLSELRDGKRFEITRLLTLRSFCDDPEAAIQFAVFLARHAKSELEEAVQRESIPDERWNTYQRLIAEAISRMDAYLADRTEVSAHKLYELRRELEQLQNEHVSIPFGAARVIQNRQALIVETALRIVVAPTRARDLAYQIARTYAERYDSRHGSGLIPASAEAVEMILDFWCGYYFGVNLEAWRRR